MKGSLEQRFWAKVDKSGGDDACWIWTAAVVKDKGYGKLSVSTSVWKPAHIVSWRLANGAVPSGLCVLHKCDNPPCVNPKHLFLGTLADNNADMKSKDRHQRGERHYDAILTDEDIPKIRLAYANRQASYSVLGRRYGVSGSAIYAVVKRKTWKHIT